MLSIKKIMLLISVACLTLSLSACSGANSNLVPERSSEIENSTDSASKTEDSDVIMKDNILLIQAGNTTLRVDLEKNAAVDALVERLSENPITIDMSDYGNMEKVGGFGFSLTQSDVQTTTEAGDLVLYQGNSLVIFYASNSWSYTRLGKIRDLTANEIKEALGDGDLTITLSLAEE